MVSGQMPSLSYCQATHKCSLGTRYPAHFWTCLLCPLPLCLQPTLPSPSPPSPPLSSPRPVLHLGLVPPAWPLCYQ